ncbi:hypothetical protein [Sphingobium boeckii]|uniref:Uncharacterized protein n=1 Tax=Sphingobium boeckii TaxID=1082345 RepID=A0A7W9EF39_9SPHN|nr:hypothetical protein [Sphingobium boeckii]MBB5686837.1 hypothetical protein [Sphingobium boeckii]
MTYISKTIDHDQPEEDAESLRWTASKQRTFLETLSFYGNVRIAAAQCFMSTRACYNLRVRHDGAAFNMGWNAAILIARGRLLDELMIRALDGQRDTIERDEEGRVAARHRFDNRLALGLLTRLDRVADAPVAGSESAEARTVAQDFEAFLALVEAGGQGEEARAFVAARTPVDADADAETQAAAETAESQRHGRCEHCLKFHDASAAECSADPDILGAILLGEFARELCVWREGEDASVPPAYWGDYLTNFPPPEGFEGTQNGVYGMDDDYSRTLTPEERAMADAKEASDTANLVWAGEMARLRWFGLPDGRDEEDEQADEDDEVRAAGGESATTALAEA